nr:hypothetical protein [uncultured Sellimonas sp.]
MDYKGILFSVAVYLILISLFWKNRKKAEKTEKDKNIKRIICICFLINTVSLICFVGGGGMTQMQDVRISRNPKGEGRKDRQFLVSVEGMCKEVPMQISVDEQGYTDAEIEEILKKESEKLGKRILGENKARNHITENLNLLSKTPDYPISIGWELDNYKYLDLSGELKEGIPKDGVTIHLKATLSFQQKNIRQKQTTWETDVRLYPSEPDTKEEMLDELKKMVEDENGKEIMKDSILLPKEVGGRKVTWEQKSMISGYRIWGLGVFLMVFAYLWKKQREEQLIRDYPEILEQFSLLMGAGMTVRNAWYKIVRNYQERKNETGVRAAYEEMEKTCFEMKGGISEREGYENFGKRCGIQEYMRFGMLLSQNLKKGTKGITQLLGLEAIHAFEERKAQARRKGEEAGTKLLVPMVMMLAVVLIIVIVPAFWSMGA